MHYCASPEIFTDNGKNLWGNAVQKYLEKIKILHKSMSSYHPWMNDKMERLNGIIDTMLGKLLLNKSMKFWDLYLNQAAFVYRTRTYSKTKTSPFYLLYDRHSHLLDDAIVALSSDARSASRDERFKFLQSTRKEIAITIYERAFKDKNMRDELV